MDSIQTKQGSSPLSSIPEPSQKRSSEQCSLEDPEKKIPRSEYSHPEHSRQRKVEALALQASNLQTRESQTTTPQSTVAKSDRDQTIEDFIHFVSADRDCTESSLSMETYIGQFCKMARFALRADQKPYLGKVLKVVTCSQNLAYNTELLTTLLMDKKYDHLSDIQRVRHQLSLAKATPSHVATRKQPPAGQPSQSISKKVPAEPIRSAATQPATPVTTAPQADEKPETNKKLEFSPKVRRGIIGSPEKVAILTRIIRSVCDGDSPNCAADQVVRAFPGKWTNAKSAHPTIKRWILTLRESDAETFGARPVLLKCKGFRTDTETPREQRFTK